MSRTAVNPKWMGGNSPLGTKLTEYVAANSKTWKQGEFCELSSGTVQPTSGTTSAVFGIFAEDQATSTSGAEKVWVKRLTTGDILEMYVKDGSSDAAIGVANIGTGYDAYQASNVCYLDVGATTGAQFKVIDLFVNYEPKRAAYDVQETASTPGLCKVEFTST